MLPPISEPADIPKTVLSHWSRFANANLQIIKTGLINITFKIETPNEKAVLQRLHPIFPVAVNKDLAVVTEHLAQQGLITPRLLPTDAGALWVDVDGIWRILSFIPGYTYTKLKSTAMAMEAGFLVGRFHTAVSSLDYQYQSARRNAHNTPAHLQLLSEALTLHNKHKLKFG